MQYIKVFSVKHILEILTVLILFQFFVYRQNIIFCDPAVKIGYFFKTGNFSMLMALDCLDKIGGFYKAFVSACIEPCKALS